MKNCIFCSLLSGKVPVDIIQENSSFFVIRDHAPKAPLHLLFITKFHVENLLGPFPQPIGNDMLEMVSTIANQFCPSRSFRLISNNGHNAGQTVDHAHIHFLAGENLPSFEKTVQ